MKNNSSAFFTLNITKNEWKYDCGKYLVNFEKVLLSKFRIIHIINDYF